MKKLLLVGAVLFAVVVIGLGAAGWAYAQSPTPNTPSDEDAPWGGMRGRMWDDVDMMGSGWMHHGQWEDGSYGVMHDFMIAALAGGLNLTTQELQERIDQGESPYEIAEGQGLSQDEISTLFTQAHEDALQAAVEAGVVSEEQADWMDQHHEQMWSENGGGCMGGSFGGRQGSRGGRGGWQGQP